MAHVAPGLVVDSVTGVDVALAVAGTGARAFAFLIDLVIRAMLVVTWYVVATLVYNGGWDLSPPLDPDGSWYAYVALPATGIFALYHCVLEIAMRGRTPGKRMVGVRLVTRKGSVPSVAANLVRNVFRLVDSFPLGYGVGLITSVVTRDHVRVGDIAAGTLLVYERQSALRPEHFVPAPRDSRLDASTAELIGELLERWSTLEVDARMQLARSLLRRGGAAEDGETLDDSRLREALERIVHAPRSEKPASATLMTDARS